MKKIKIIIVQKLNMHNNRQMRRYQSPHLRPLHSHLSSSNKADSKQQPTFINKLKKKKTIDITLFCIMKMEEITFTP